MADLTDERIAEIIAMAKSKVSPDSQTPAAAFVDAGRENVRLCRAFWLVRWRR